MTKRIRILILAVALIAGLALPFGVAALQDIFGTHVWQVNDDAHYKYSGTLRNRAIALNAYRNGATNITAVITEQSDDSLFDLLSKLCKADLIPAAATASNVRSKYLTILPKGYTARYEYIDSEQDSSKVRTHTILDVQSNRCLVIEYQCTPAELAQWLSNVSLMELLRRFAAYWGYDSIKESTGSASRNGIMSQSAAISGTFYTVTVVTMPNVGLISYSLSAS